MKIYTGYFAKKKKYEEAGLKVISIARYTPEWVGEITDLNLLAPDSKLLRKYKNEKINEQEFIRTYNSEVLNKLTCEEVVSYLRKISEGRDIVLCCFESRGKFCHRHVLAKWLTEGGYNVKEFEC